MLTKLRLFLSQQGRDAYNGAVSRNVSDISRLILQLYNNPQIAATLEKALNSANRKETSVPNYYLSRYLVERLRREPTAQQINQPSIADYERLVRVLSQKPESGSNWDDKLNEIVRVVYSPETSHEETRQVAKGHEEEVYEETWPDPHGGDDNRAGPDKVVYSTIWVDDDVVEESYKVIDQPSTLTISCNFGSSDNNKVA